MTMNHPDFEQITCKRNREQATYPITSGRVWCEKCDANLIHVGEKCNVCNTKWKTKHRKKQ